MDLEVLILIFHPFITCFVKEKDKMSVKYKIVIFGFWYILNMNWTQNSFWVCLQRWNSLYKESQWWPRIRRCKIRSSGAIQTTPLGRSQKIGYKNFEKSSPNKNLTKSGKKWRKLLCFFSIFFKTRKLITQTRQKKP